LLGAEVLEAGVDGDLESSGRSVAVLAGQRGILVRDTNLALVRSVADEPAEVVGVRGDGRNGLRAGQVTGRPTGARQNEPLDDGFTTVLAELVLLEEGLSSDRGRVDAV
jgi:hypothetical protein